jgi:hypothetical protein
VSRWIVPANLALAAVFAGLFAYAGARLFDNLFGAPVGALCGVLLYLALFMP